MSDPGAYELKFGVHIRKPLSVIADLPGGLRYLSWLSRRNEVWADTKAKIKAFLDQPEIAERLRLAPKRMRTGQTHANAERAKEYGMS